MQTHSKQYSPYFVLKNNTADNVNMFTWEQLGVKLQQRATLLSKEHCPLWAKTYNTNDITIIIIINIRSHYQ